MFLKNNNTKLFFVNISVKSLYLLLHDRIWLLEFCYASYANNNNKVYTLILDLNKKNNISYLQYSLLGFVFFSILLRNVVLLFYSIISLLLTIFAIIHIIVNRNVMRGLKRPNTIK